MNGAALVVVGTFLLVALLILGPYYFFIVRPESAAQEVLRQRIRTGGSARATRAPRLSLLKEVERLSAIGPLNKLLTGQSRVAERLRGTIQLSGLNVTPGQIVLGSACLALACYLLTLHWIPRLSAAVVVGVVAGLLPYGVLRFMYRRQLHKFEEQFPEAVDLIARTLRAGHAFTTGIRVASEELPAPVDAQFKLLYEQQNYGMPLPDALKALAQRVPIMDARFFVTAVLTQREAGGNLAEVLDNLAAVIRERFRVKRQLRVITAHGRMTGLVLASMPPALAVYMLIRTPEHFKILIEDPAGIRMIVVAIVLQILGALLIAKISNVEYSTHMSSQFWLALAGVFVSVALLAGGITSAILSGTSATRRRLSRVVRGPEVASAFVAAPTALAEAPTPFWDRLADALPTSRGTVKRLRRELALAGFHAVETTALFSLSELVLPVLFAIPPILMLDGTHRWMGAGIGAVMGNMTPGFLLRLRLKRRQKEIENGLADALDLLVLCLEAGSSLDQAIVKASEELEVAYPALGDQLRIVISEMRAGKARLDAFRGLAARTQVDDVRALVAMLVQTDRFGTSIAQALRTHAEVCRTKRRQRAEEKAQKVGVKLVFPLVFFLFPALYVVLLGPAFLEFERVFSQTGK